MSGLRESVAGFTENIEGVGSKEVIQMMMITQYFDMLKDIGGNSKSSTVFTSHSPAAINDLQTQIKQGFMEAASGL